MPEQEAEISNSEQDVYSVEGFVESLSDVWQREYADSKKDCQRWYTSVLKDVSE